MKDKGFTLIEMLVVIVIIGSIGLIVTISFMQSLSDTYQDQCDDFVEEVENAASVYASLTSTDCDVDGIDQDKCCDRDKGTCEIYLTDLLEAGLLSTETDACTNKLIETEESEEPNKYYVIVKWDSSSGEKTSVYQGDVTYGD